MVTVRKNGYRKFRVREYVAGKQVWHSYATKEEAEKKEAEVLCFAAGTTYTRGKRPAFTQTKNPTHKKLKNFGV